MNRDTLYSFVVADLSQGADLTVPDADGRDLSMMVINQDHYINEVFHDAGTYHLTTEAFGSPHVGIGSIPTTRTMLPASMPSRTNSDSRHAPTGHSSCRTTIPPRSTPPGMPCWTWLAGWTISPGRFGAWDQVNPIQHLIASAAGWGGLPPCSPAPQPKEPLLRSMMSICTHL